MSSSATAREGDAIDPAAVTALLAALQQQAYRFVTPTPFSHARVLARPDRKVAKDLADVFGWNLPYPAGVLAPELEGILARGRLTGQRPDGLSRSRVRVSSLGRNLFAHSSYPTEAADAVFFGPDSYRFANLIQDEIERMGAERIGSIIDIGTGSGVGAVVAGSLCPAAVVLGTDINPRALAFATANAEAAEVVLETTLTETLDDLAPADLILANPPYIIDSGDRDYRDGGDNHGAGVAIEMSRQALRKLNRGGRFVLYSGSTIVRGHDPLQAAVATLAAETGIPMRYRELDPDVFGEELANQAYCDADRISLVAAVFSRG